MQLYAGYITNQFIIMQNPYLKVVVNGIMQDYISLSYSSLAAPMTVYSFTKHLGMAGPGYLVIAPKDAFSNPEDAITAMIQRILYEDEEWTKDYCTRFTDDDIKWLTNDFLLPIYAMQEIRKITREKFRKEYDYLVNIGTRYTHINEDKSSFEGYLNKGIAKNGEEITDYINFDPLRDIDEGDCYAIFDNEKDRTEYFAVSPDYYIYLFWFWPHEKLSPFRGWK
jgi:hypothetical protein